MYTPLEPDLPGAEAESAPCLRPAEERAARDAQAGKRIFKPDVENPSDTLVRALTGPRCKASRVISIELVEQRWNGNDLYKAVCPEKTFFVKVNETLDAKVFMAESGGLVCIAKAKCGLKVPEPFDIGVFPPCGEVLAGSFMILSWVDHQPMGAFKGNRMEDFGSALAQLHSADFSSTHQGRYGFASTTWIGTTAQDNSWCTTWQELFHRRMAHQLERANALCPSSDAAASDEGAISITPDPVIQELGLRLLAQLGSLLAPVAAAMQPALLHGDLWIGNTLWLEVGPVVIDPACCFGHSEFDLALMHLFGGFTEACFEAYHLVLPKAEGFETRQKLYQVYHRLNLLGTFGNLAEGEAAKTLMQEVLTLLG